MTRAPALAFPLLALASVAAAQPSVSIDMTGLSIASTPSTPADAVRNSGVATVSAAPGYRYVFNPTVRGTGLLGIITIPSPTPLGDVLNTFVPGQYRVVTGAMRNPGGMRPAQVFFNAVGGTFSGLTISLTLDLDVLANGQGQAAIRNITKPSGLGISVTAGAATISAWTPPPPVISEWHFDGGLSSVRESGLYPDSGHSQLAYLDDARFGAILGGPGQENQLPSPPTPHGITASQYAFGTADSFSLPNLGDGASTVMRVSPPRNLADPANRAKSRGIGLALWPNNRDTWPDDKLSNWTIVWDIYIPASSWSVEYPVALLETNHNNDASADMFIRQSSGNASIGFAVAPGQYIAAPQIAPGRWMRLAFVSDGYRLGQGRIFVDGSLVGVSGGDWIYNSTDRTMPRYGDVSTSQPLGTPVPAALWSQWGSFPSPWAIAPNANNAAPMASTLCLFSDLAGRGETFYVMNMMFTDEAMSDAAVAALGPVDPLGIVLKKSAAICIADFNGDGGVDGADVEAFFVAWVIAEPLADVNQDGGIDGADIETFFIAWSSATC
jgi:hypothetical protein